MATRAELEQVMEHPEYRGLLAELCDNKKVECMSLLADWLTDRGLEDAADAWRWVRVHRRWPTPTGWFCDTDAPGKVAGVPDFLYYRLVSVWSQDHRREAGAFRRLVLVWNELTTEERARCWTFS